jgi:hypothetical protein
MKKIEVYLDKGWDRLEVFMDKAQWWILGTALLYIIGQVVRFFIMRQGGII